MSAIRVEKQVPPGAFNAAQASAYLGGISRQSLWRLAKEGKLRTVKLGKRTAYPRGGVRRAPGRRGAVKRGCGEKLPVSARRPVSGSDYDFFVRALEILDQEPSPGWASAEIPISPNMTFRERKQAEVWNAQVESFERMTREGEVRRLHEAGMLPAGCEIICPRQRAVVDQIVDLVRNTIHEATGGEGHGIVSFEPHVRALVAAKILARNKSETRAAERLNEGISHRLGGKNAGLTRHHVRRAWERFVGDPFVRTRLGFGCALTVIVDQFRNLDRILDEARPRPEFKGVHGAELANLIDERYHLATCAGKTGLKLINFVVLLKAA